MVGKILKKPEGDSVIWGIVALTMMASVFVVGSASSNLAWRGDNTMISVFSILLKHAVFLLTGLGFMYAAHRVPYKYLSSFSMILLPIGGVLLAFTLFQGNEIGGANASRWIRIIPFTTVSIQTSTVASLILMTYVSRYLSKIQGVKVKFKESLLPLWLPVIVYASLILPANFSTAALMILNVGILLIIGRYPIKHLLLMLTVGVAILTIFISLAFKFPDAFPNRVGTWTSRIEQFTSDDAEPEQYQVKAAKVAISLGGFFGQGPGKSTQKNHLPQSSSDFIFAIVIEEFGALVGGLGLIILYVAFLFRVVKVASDAPSTFGMLITIAMGVPIVIQAMVNMAVAVGLFPVTGQPLPLISSGGTSIWMISISIGMILSVSRCSNLKKELGIEHDDADDSNDDISNLKLEDVI
ncbi:MAG: FtsW/RodA/SpoVE family cell cycle protein [Ichthyobacteriaceae bacterium]|nr:FtsW/RodA/SpoVE family cell cycle protein [Ichthyobacteriaceae bacterium]